MRANPQTQAAIQATLGQWADAYSARDLDRALALIAPDDDLVGIGTGQDEWRVGIQEFKAQLERDFAQAEALSVDYEPLVVSEAGSVAWVAGRARVQARGWPGPGLGRSLHRRPGAARRPLAAGADSFLAAGSRAGRGSILLSGVRAPGQSGAPSTLGRAGAAGDVDGRDAQGHRRTTRPEVGQADRR